MSPKESHTSLREQAGELFRRGEWIPAIRSIDKALDLHAGDTYLLNLRARAFEALGQFEDALRSLDRCLDQDPANVADLRNRGLVLLKLGRGREALASFDAALRIAPQHVDVLIKRAYLLHQLDRREEALASAERAVAAAPRDLHALNVRGMILDNFCRYEDALADFERILAIDPNFADAINNRGMIHARYGQFEEALSCYGRSLALAPGQPQALYNQAMVRLALGDWTQGFRDFECRWHIAPLEAARLHRLAPVWLGKEDVAGKTVLVHHEQGYGDSLQFVRYVPLVARRGASVIVAVPGGLRELMNTLPGATRVISEGEAVPPHDYCCPMMSLPLVFETTPETVPAEIPYLLASAEKARIWAQRLGSRNRPRIGLVWSGRRYAPINHPRDMPLEVLRPLFTLPADFVCLQTEISDDDRRVLESTSQITVYGEQLKNFADTAALIENLDLVVSVDTAVAHLAGAMGKPVWLMNRYASCWRWLQRRSDSPWYPTLRQFRQSRVGDWSGVVQEVCGAAKALIGHHRGGEGVSPQNDGLAATPRTPAVDEMLARALREHNEGRRAKAIAGYEELLRIWPDHPEALHFLGVALAQDSRCEEATATLGRVVQLQPDNADAHNHHANALAALSRYEEALAGYERALALKPRLADVYYNRGVALEKMGRPGDALASYEQALLINPAYAAAYNNRGNVLVDLKKLGHALASYERATALRPDYLEAWINRANVLRMLHDYDKAYASAQRALSLGPDHAEAHGSAGAVLACVGRYDEALRHYQRAIELKPDLADGLWNKAILHLSRGEFSEGWPLYETRWRVKSLGLSHRCGARPLWLGRESLQDKTILLHAEQGYGDTIQFCRYVPLVAAKGGRVILGAPEALKGLMESLEGAEQVISRGPLPSYDLHCPLLSLPYAFGTSLNDIPAAGAYLRADPARRQHWAARLGNVPETRVGLVWSGKPTHSNDLNRSITLAELAPLLERRATWISVQKDLRARDTADLAALPQLLPHGQDLTDFADAAALVAELDLVITVDTVIAHLAGALGKRVWILLPFVSDWRWLQERTDSPWYPTARLFRQNHPRDWANVVSRVGSALDEFLADPHPRKEPVVGSHSLARPVKLFAGSSTERLH